MKKIALLHYAYPPNIGGVEKLMAEEAVILSDLGYDVLVLTGSGEEVNPKIKLIEDNEFQSVLSFNPSLQEKIIKKGIIDEEFYRLAERIEKKLNAYLFNQDVIVVHNMLTLVHNLPFIYAFKKYSSYNPQKKVIVWTHDQTFIDKGKIIEKKEGVNLSREGRELLMTPLDSAIYIAISESFKELFAQVINYPEEKITVVTNGLNIKRFLEIDQSIWKIVEKYSLLQRFPLILSPVNILERKNLEYCLDIIFFLKKHYPSITYIISGRQSAHRDTGGYLELLKKKITKLNLKKNAIFLGEIIKRALEDAEIHDLYDLSDAVFYFSKSENFGLPILEASLTKTPIFVSNLDVFYEIGGKNLVYIDYRKKSAKEVAGLVWHYLEKSSIIKLNKIARQKYNLETIIKEKLLPLI